MSALEQLDGEQFNVTAILRRIDVEAKYCCGSVRTGIVLVARLIRAQQKELQRLRLDLAQCPVNAQERLDDLQQFHDWAEPQITDLKRGVPAETPAPRTQKEIAYRDALDRITRITRINYDRNSVAQAAWDMKEIACDVLGRAGLPNGPDDEAGRTGRDAE